jgi:hypothetical protein
LNNLGSNIKYRLYRPLIGNMRTTNALRVILAVVFGFMSLGHAPVMTFAKANQPALAQVSGAAPAAEHHHHHHRPASQTDQIGDGVAPAPQNQSTCNAASCFVLVPPPLVGEPNSALLLLGTLSAAPSADILAAPPDPLVPPPRLQA